MKDKLLKTIKENGFLLFLFICVCLVAASTIFIVTKEVDKPKEDKEELVILEDEERNLDLKDIAVNKDEDNTLEITAKDEFLESEDESEETQEIEDKIIEDLSQSEELEETFKVEKEEDLDEIEFIEDDIYEMEQVESNIIMPVDGEIITAFTKDNLIYSETLEEWRGHSGIDIKADIGTKVKAIKEGVVKEVYEDNLWGNIIVIDHGNGLESKYSNLGTRDMVKVGIEVKQGDYISTVGNSANIEMLMDSHLHFEIIKDGEIVDPRSIIKWKSISI